MQSKKPEWSFTICRDPQERRIAKFAAPPYLTEEGLTLVDRRMNNERRDLECETELYSQEEFSFACTS